MIEVKAVHMLLSKLTSSVPVCPLFLFLITSWITRRAGDVCGLPSFSSQCIFLKKIFIDRTYSVLRHVGKILCLWMIGGFRFESDDSTSVESKMNPSRSHLGLKAMFFLQNGFRSAVESRFTPHVYSVGFIILEIPLEFVSFYISNQLFQLRFSFIRVSI